MKTNIVIFYFLIQICSLFGQNLSFNLVVSHPITCFGGSDGGVSVTSLAGGTPPYQTKWSNGKAQTLANDSLNCGNYSVTVTDANQLESVKNIEIRNPPAIQFDILVKNPSCNTSNDGKIEVQNISNAQVPVTYFFNKKNTTDSIFSNQKSGRFQIKIKDSLGCEVEKDSFVDFVREFLIYAGENKSIKLGESAEIKVESNYLLDSIVWQPNVPCKCDLAEVTPYFSTDYKLTAYFAGCVATDEVRVAVNRRPEIFVPNAFSPNRDDKNELFQVFYNKKQVTSIQSLRIYDRAGSLVFSQQTEPNGADPTWDGTQNGAELSPAVFTYFIEYQLIDDTLGQMSGEVTLWK